VVVEKVGKKSLKDGGRTSKKANKHSNTPGKYKRKPPGDETSSNKNSRVAQRKRYNGLIVMSFYDVCDLLG